MAAYDRTSLASPIPYGRYELLEPIGAGGMAEVFRARLPGVAGFEKQVVIKRLQPRFREDERFKRMFVEEAKLASQVQHKNVVQVFELGNHEGELYMVLEYVPGTDMKRLLRQASVKRLSLPMWLSVHIAIEMLEALAYAHDLKDGGGQRRNIVHCDVTPENVFLSTGGEVKLGDFGVAHDETRCEEDFPGEIRGKLAYMAPEQLSGRQVDQRADVFSAAVVLWEALTQRRLFRGPTDDDTVARICQEDRIAPSVFNKDVPAQLDSAVLAALRADRTRRTRTARELQRALIDIQTDLGHRVALVDVERALRKILNADTPPGTQAEDPANDPSKVPTVESEIPSDGRERFSPPDGSRPQVRWATRAPDPDPETDLPEVRARQRSMAASRDIKAPAEAANADRRAASATPPSSPVPGWVRTPASILGPARPATRAPKSIRTPTAAQKAIRMSDAAQKAIRTPTSMLKAVRTPTPGPKASRATTPAPTAVRATPSSPGVSRPSTPVPKPTRTPTPVPSPTPRPAAPGPGPTLRRHDGRASHIPRRAASVREPAALPLSLTAGWTAALTGAEPPRLPPGHLPRDPSPLAVAPMQGGTAQVETADILRSPLPKGTPIPRRIQSGSVRVLAQAPDAEGPGVWLRRPGGAETGPRPVPDALTVLRRLLLDSPVLDAQVSVDGKTWHEGTTLARLLGEEVVPADGLLPFTDDRGSLAQTSLVAIFGRLSRRRQSGRLIIVLDRPGRPERYELHVHRGRLFHVASSRSLFAAWRSLLGSPQVEQPQLRSWVGKVIEQTQPFELVAAPPAVEAVRAQQAHYAQSDLQTLFAQHAGRYAFAAHPSPPSPNGSGHALLTLLPSLISRACRTSDLERRLRHQLGTPMERSPGFESEASQLGLSLQDAAALDRFTDGSPLSRALAEPSDPRQRKLTLVLAYTLLELGLLRPCIKVAP